MLHLYFNKNIAEICFLFCYVSISVFYFCITNYHKIRSLKTALISCSKVLQIRSVRMASLTSAQSLTRLKSKCQLGYIIIWSWIPILVSFRLLAEFSSLVVGLRSLFSCVNYKLAITRACQRRNNYGIWHLPVWWLNPMLL